MFRNVRLAAVLCSWFVVTVPVFAEIPLVDNPQPGQITLIYDPSDGNLSVDGGGFSITTFQLASESGVFRAEWPRQLRGIFDDYRAHELFYLSPGETAWQSIDFGRAIIPGQGPELAVDLTLDGSVLPRGRFGLVGLQMIPEPAGTTLVLPLLPLLPIMRRHIGSVEQRRNVRCS
jgi:hypothetical protein